MRGAVLSIAPHASPLNANRSTGQRRYERFTQTVLADGPYWILHWAEKPAGNAVQGSGLTPNG
jgi:hypothetical protein